MDLFKSLNEEGQTIIMGPTILRMWLFLRTIQLRWKDCGWHLIETRGVLPKWATKNLSQPFRRV
jgi:hypothetical protein